MRNVIIALVAVFLTAGAVTAIVFSKNGGNGESQTSAGEAASISESVKSSESFNHDETESVNDTESRSETDVEKESNNESKSENESLSASEQESLSAFERESEQTSEVHIHSFDRAIEEEKYFASEATCAQRARYYYSCECGEAGERTFEVGGFAEHTPVIDKGYAATCDDDGLTDGAHCSVCGAVITARKIIPAVGHNYESGICSVCEDVELTDNKYFTFTLLNDGGYSIGANLELKSSSLNGVKLPAAYNEQPVVSVAVDGFDGCQFTKLIVPEGIKILGESCFGNCDKLTSVSLPDSLTEVSALVFKNCTSLKCVIIPDGVEKIGTATFNGCSSLESLIIPFVGDRKNAIATDSDIYSFGFIFGATGYEKDSYYVSQHCKTYGSYSRWSFYLPLSLKYVMVTGGEIFSYAFEGCASLKKIDIPQNTTQIGEYAFCACGIESFDVPLGVTRIENNTFSSCDRLKEIQLPAGLKEIEDEAFSGCDNLTSLMIPDSVMNIGERVFLNCNDGLFTRIDGLLYVDNWVVGVEDKEITSANIINDAVGIAGGSFALCRNLTDITIPEGVKDIGSGAFVECNLVSVKIPNGLTIIKKSVFANCSNLVSVNIPESVTRIEDYAFVGCKFTNIIIPDGVTYIGYNAFGYCQELQEITIPQNVIFVGWNAFTNCDNLHVVYWNAINCKYAGDRNDPIFNSRKYVNVGKKIIIGDMVESIPPYAFYLRMYEKGDSVSVSVIIPDSVKELGEDSFLGFYGNLYYCGTEEQWNVLYHVDDNIPDFSPFATYYYYSENKPEEINKFWHYDADGNPVLWI